MTFTIHILEDGDPPVHIELIGATYVDLGNGTIDRSREGMVQYPDHEFSDPVLVMCRDPIGSLRLLRDRSGVPTAANQCRTIDRAVPDRLMIQRDRQTSVCTE